MNYHFEIDAQPSNYYRRNELLSKLVLRMNEEEYSHELLNYASGGRVITDVTLAVNADGEIITEVTVLCGTTQHTAQFGGYYLND